MRKIVLALAAAAAFGIAMPVVSTPAEAGRNVVIIKKKKAKHWNRGHHYGWYKQKNKHKRHHRGATVVIR
jgi:hypothetical protein